MKIQSRFLLFLLSFYTLILVVGILAQYYSFRVFSGYLYESVSEIFHSSAGSFTNSIDNLEQLTITIIADEATQDFLKQELQADNDYKRNVTREALMQDLSLHTLINPFLREIILVDSNKNLYHANTNNSQNVMFREIMEGSIRRETLSLHGKHLWSVIESSLTPLVLSRMINLIGYYIEQPKVTLYYFVDIEKLLEENFSQIKHYGLKTSIYYKGDLFYSLLNAESDKIKMTMGSKHYQTIWFEGEPHFTTKIQTGDKEWEFLFLIPTKELFEEFYNLNRIIYLVYLLFFIFFSVLIIRSSKHITSPIITLSREMKAMDDRDFVSSEPIKLPAKASDEVSLLYHEFYQMIDKIDNLVNKNLKQQLALNQSQLEVLSSQLNPHFLYNTLDSLYWMAEISKQPEMATIVKSLSSLLRNSLNKAEPLISVKEQLDLLNDYFSIQKIRFKDRLEYIINVDHKLYARGIPRFTLQPLVENSIKYSLEEKQSKCLIEVSMRANYAFNGMDILIRDNGPGVNQERTSPRNTGIGLANLTQRISLIYGNEGRIKIDTNMAGGTDISIFIPFEKESQK